MFYFVFWLFPLIVLLIGSICVMGLALWNIHLPPASLSFQQALQYPTDWNLIKMFFSGLGASIISFFVLASSLE